MLEGYVSRAVEGALAAYFEFEEVEAAGVGDVSIRKLKLKPSVVPANLPVRVRECTVDRVHVKVQPLGLLWIGSGQYAASATIERLHVVLDERPSSEWDEFTEFETLKATKLGLIATMRDAAMQALEAKLSGLSGSLGDPAPTDSVVMSLVKRIATSVVDNLVVRIDDVRISYCFEGHSSSGEVGLSISRIHLENTKVLPKVYSAQRQPETLDSDSVEETRIGDVLVQPVQGSTSKIVRKQLHLDDVNIFYQATQHGKSLERTSLIEPFFIEAVLAANIAADPGPTMGIAELRVSKLKINLKPDSIAALTYMSETLSKQAEWKEVCNKRFLEMVQTGLTADEQKECFALYVKIIEKGALDVGPKTKPPKNPPTRSQSGLQAMHAGLSWLEQCELKAHPNAMITMLNSAAALVAKRERAKAETNAEQRTGRISSAFSWLVGTGNGTNTKANANNDAELVKTATNLSLSLGLEKGLDEKQRKRHYQSVFEAIDTDHSGRLSVSELQLGLAMAGTTLSTSATRDLVRKFDKNADGHINLDEFIELCKMAPDSVQSGEKAKSVAALSLSILGVEIDMQAKNVRMKALISSCQAATAIEGFPNVTIGQKGGWLTLGALQVEFSGKGKSSEPQEVLCAEENPIKALSSQPTPSAVSSQDSVPESRCNIKSTVTVKSVRFSPGVELVEATPYCSTRSVSQSESSDTPVHTCLGTAGSGNGEFEFQGDASTLELITQLENQPKPLTLEIQVRARPNKSGWHFFSGNQGKGLVKPKNTDKDIGVARMDIEIPALNNKLRFSKLFVDEPTSYDEVVRIQGSDVEIIMEVEQVITTRGDPLKDEVPSTLMHAAARTSLGYANLALCAKLPRLYINADKKLTPMLEDMNEDLADVAHYAIWAPTQGKQEQPSAEEPPSTTTNWYASKPQVQLQFVDVEGLSGKQKVVRCNVDCGNEHLGLDPFSKTEHITLGELTNLKQHIVSGRNDFAMVLELSDGSKHAIGGISVARLVSLDRFDESMIWCKTFVMDKNQEPNQAISTQSPGVIRVLLQIKGKAPSTQAAEVNPQCDHSEGELDLSAPVNGTTADSESRLGPVPPSSWLEQEPADLLGLAYFPSLLQNNVATLCVHVVSASGLKASDVGGTSDPYCVVSCNNQEFRTPIASATLEPSWKEMEASRPFSFGPLTGQDLTMPFENITITVKDSDIGGEWNHDLLGVAYLPVNELYDEIWALKQEDKADDLNRSRVSSVASLPSIASDAIDPSKRLKKTFQIQLPDTASTSEENQSQGSVTVEVWLEPCDKERKPVSIIPMTIDATFELTIKLPEIIVPKDSPYNGTGKDVCIEGGEPVVTWHLNQGATLDLSRGVGISTQIPPPTEERKQNTFEASDEQSDEEFSEPYSDRDGVDDTIDAISGFYSVREGSRAQSFGRGSVDFDDFYSLASYEDDRNTFNDAMSESRSRRGSTMGRYRGNNYINRHIFDSIRVKSSIRIDLVSLSVLLVSNKAEKTRYPLFSFGVESFKLDCNYALYEWGLPLICVDLELSELHLRDQYEGHRIIGRSLKENVSHHLPQVRLAARYIVPDSELETWDGDNFNAPVPALSVVVQVNRSFVLVTAVAVFIDRLIRVFQTSSSNASPPHEGDKADETTAQSPMDEFFEDDQEENNTLEEEEIAANGNGWFLPTSRVLIVTRINDLELHLSDRRALSRKSDGRVERFPPKSLIILTSISLRLHSASRSSKEFGEHAGLPAIEKIEAKIVSQAIIAHTRLERSAFLEEPGDFKAGESMIVDPFTIIAMVSVEPIESVKKFKLLEATAVDSETLDSQESVALRRFDSNSVTSHQTRHEKENAPQNFGFSNVLLSNEWGVRDYVHDAESAMNRELNEAKKASRSTVRDTRIRVEGFEARLDTSDQLFLFKVSEIQSSVFATIGVEEEEMEHSEHDEIGSSRGEKLRASSTGSEALNDTNGAELRFVTQSGLEEDLKEEDVTKLPSVVYDAAQLSNELTGAGTNAERARLNEEQDDLKRKSQRTKLKSSSQHGGNSASTDSTPWLIATMAPMFVLCSTTRVFRRRRITDGEGFWTMKRDGRFLGVLSKRALKKLETAKSFEQVNVFLPNAMLALGSNHEGFPVPFLRFVISQTNVSACSRTTFVDELQMRGFGVFSTTTYNHLSMAWEPFLEPWPLSLIAEMSEGTHGVLSQVIAPKRLNINVTDAFLQGLNDLSLILQPGFEAPDDERLHGSFSPNWVVNETGHNIQIWPIKDTKEQLKSTKPEAITFRGDPQIFSVSHGEARRLHLHDTSKLRKSVSSLLRRHRERKRHIMRSVLRQFGQANRSGSSRTGRGSFRSSPAEREKLLRQDLMELFAELDRDGSGEITCIELQHTLSQEGDPISVEEVLYALGEMDSKGQDQSNLRKATISLHEFLDFFTADTSTKDCTHGGSDIASLAFQLDELPDLTDGAVRVEDGKAPMQIVLAPASSSGQFMLRSVPTGVQENVSKRDMWLETSSHVTDVTDNIEDDDFEFSSQEGDSSRPSAQHRKSLPGIFSSTLTQSKRNIGSTLHPERLYHFPSFNTSNWWCVGNIKKMGKSSAANVLFLETPIRLENRTMVRLEFVLVCNNSAGETVLQEHVCFLTPGQEQSVPMKYLYARHYFGDAGTFGIAVRPNFDEDEHKRLEETTQGRSASDSKRIRYNSDELEMGSGGKNVNQSRENLGPEDSNADGEKRRNSMQQNWMLSELLLVLHGGQGVSLATPPRIVDDLLDKDGKPLNNLLTSTVKEGDLIQSGLVAANRVSFEPCASESQHQQQQQQSAVAPPLRKSFETVMLTQRNGLRMYENKRVLTIQILGAKHLRACDANGLSDPYVVAIYGKEKKRTPVIKRTLDPVWPNKATFRFGEELPLDESRSITLRVMDHDSFSKHDVLGYKRLSVGEILSWFNESAGLSSGSDVIQRTFPLEAGKGVSESKVRGAITLGFTFNPNAAVLETPLNFAQHVFSFYPSLILENALPFPIEVNLRHKTDEGTVLGEIIITLAAGASKPCYSLDGALLDFLSESRRSHERGKTMHKAEDAMCCETEGEADVRVRIIRESEPQEWSEPLARPNTATDLWKGTMLIGSVSAEVERRTSDGGGRRLFFYAPFWMVNNSDMVLDYQPMEDIRQKPSKSDSTESKREPATDGPTANQKQSCCAPLCGSEELSERSLPWVAKDDPGGYVRCLFLDSEYGRINLRGRPVGYPSMDYFEADYSKPLLDKDDDMRTGATTHIKLTSPSFHVDPSKTTAAASLVVILEKLTLGKSEQVDTEALHRVGFGIMAGVNSGESSEFERIASELIQPDEGISEVRWSPLSGALVLPVPLRRSKIGLTLQFRAVKAEPSLNDETQTVDLSHVEAVGQSASIELPGSLLDNAADVAGRHELNLGDGFSISFSVHVFGVPVTGRASNSPARRPTLSGAKKVALAKSGLKEENPSLFCRELAVTMKPIPGEFAMRTTVLNVQPRFLMANFCDFPLLVRQVGEPEIGSMVLKGRDRTFGLQPATDYELTDERKPFDFVRQDGPRKIQIKACTPSATWSQPFPIEDIDDFGIQLRREDGSRLSRVWVDANHSNGSDFFVFRTLSHVATPYGVQNFTLDRKFAVLQVDAVKVGIMASVKNVCRANDMKDIQQRVECSDLQVDVVSPGHELALALDIPPEEDKRVTIVVIPVNKSDDESLEYEHAVRIRYKEGLEEPMFTSDGGELGVTVIGEGSRKIVRVVDYALQRVKGTDNARLQSSSSKKQKGKGGKAHDAGRSSTSKRHKEQERLREMHRNLQPSKPSFELLVSLSSVCMSLFSSKMQLEVAYLALQRVHYEMATEVMSGQLTRTTTELSIAHIQMDSSQVNAKFPVMLFSMPIESLSKREKVKSIFHSFQNRLMRKREAVDKDARVLSSVSNRAKSRTKLLWDKYRAQRERAGAFRLQMVYDADPTGASSFDIYRYFRLRLRPIVLRVDGVFLAGLLTVLDPLLQPAIQAGSLEGEGVVLGVNGDVNNSAMDALIDELDQPIPVPVQDTVYFDHARIERTKVVVTVNLGSDNDLKRLLQQYGISPFFLTLIKRVARLEDLSLDLREGHYDALTAHKFTFRHTSRINTDVVRQLHEVALNFVFRLAKNVPLLRRSSITLPKIRQPVVVNSHGVLQAYGPGRHPRLLESREEKQAAIVLERFFMLYANSRQRSNSRAVGAPGAKDDSGPGAVANGAAASNHTARTNARNVKGKTSCLPCC